MRRIAIPALLLLAAVGIWRAPMASSADVDVTVSEIGWWSSRPGALAQPEGGFEVAASPTGDTQSIAALRLSIAATQVDSLQVRFDETASVGTQVGAMKMCATTSSWTPANPGPMTEAPAADCTISAGLTRTVDGVWLGDATALAPNGGVVSIVIVPNYNPPAPIGPGLVVTISGGDLTATGSSTTVTTQPGETTTTIFDGGSGFGFDSGFDSFGGGSFGVPSSGVEPDFGTATPSPPVTTVSDQGPGVDDFALDPEPIDNEPPPPWIRLVLLLPLSVGFGFGSVRLRRLATEGWSVEPGQGRLDVLLGLFKP